MTVKELRKLLNDMPENIHVYIPEGSGLSSAKHIWKIGRHGGLSQFCELTFFGKDAHTPQGEIDESWLKEQGYTKNV